MGAALQMVLGSYAGAAIVPTNRLSVTATSVGTASTTHNVAMPATVVAGDLLIAQIAANSPGTITTPAGWSLLEGPFTSGTTTALYTRVADGSEGGTTVNFATANSVQLAADVHRIQAGTYTAGLLSVFGIAGGADFNPDPPSIPIPWGDTTNTVLALFSNNFNSAASGFPSGYSEGRTTASDATIGSSAVAQVGSAIKGGISGASENPGAFTISQSRVWGAHTLLISPGGVEPLDGPVVLSHEGDYFSTDTTSHAVNMPAAVNAGDLLIMVFANHFTSTPTTPSGWTQLFQDVGGAVQTTTAYYKIAAGTEGGTTVDVVTSAAEKATAYVARIQAGTFDASAAPEAGAVNTGTSLAPLANAMSPSWGRQDTLFLAVVGADNRRALDDATVLGYPGGGFNASGGATSISTGASVYAAHMIYRSATSWPATFDLTNSQTWTARTIAIKPAP